MKDNENNAIYKLKVQLKCKIMVKYVYIWW